MQIDQHYLMAPTIKVTVLRALLMHGQRIEAGAELELAPLLAADAVASGRAVFADPSDTVRVRIAVADQRDKLLGKLNATERQRAAAGWVRRVA